MFVGVRVWVGVKVIVGVRVSVGVNVRVGVRVSVGVGVGGRLRLNVLDTHPVVDIQDSLLVALARISYSPLFSVSHKEVGMILHGESPPKAQYAATLSVLEEMRLPSGE